MFRYYRVTGYALDAFTLKIHDNQIIILELDFPQEEDIRLAVLDHTPQKMDKAVSCYSLFFSGGKRFRLCVHREGEPLNLLRPTEKDQNKYCLHIRLFKPRIILNSRVKHLEIGLLLRRRSLPLDDYYRPKNSDYTLKSVEMEELSVLSQRVT